MRTDPSPIFRQPLESSIQLEHAPLKNPHLERRSFRGRHNLILDEPRSVLDAVTGFTQ
jgi:hypothetical protein